MNKITTLLIIVLLTTLFSGSSCSKKDDLSGTDLTGTDLTGTSWKSGNLDGEYDMLKFTSKTAVEIWAKYDNETIYSLQDVGVYSISGNQITFNFEADGGSLKGTITSKTITFEDSESHAIFTKQ